MSDLIEIYCIKCKKKVEFSNGTVKTNKRGGRYIQGNCNVCYTKVNQFLKKDTKIDVDLPEDTRG